MHEDYRFVDFWIQGQKTIKSSLMGLVLMTSGAKTGKSWHNITSKNWPVEASRDPNGYSGPEWVISPEYPNT